MKTLVCSIALVCVVVCTVWASVNSGIGTRLQSPQATFITIAPDTVRFDTSCGVRACKTITITNTSKQVIDRIRTDSSLQKPFQLQGAITSTSLGIGNSTQLTICYDATSVNTAKDTLHLWADIRDPFNLAMLFDVSGSMDFAVSSKDGTRRIKAATTAGNNFLNKIYAVNRTTPDTVAVFSFSANNRSRSNFKVDQNFTTTKSLLISAVNLLNPSGGTCLFNAIDSASKRLRLRKNPILILLSDGENKDCSETDTETSCIAAAKNAGVTVYVIGIVDSTVGINKSFVASLRKIATSTGGKLYTAVTASELDKAYADLIDKLSADEEFTVPIFGKAGGANIQISPASVSFDSVKVGDERCTIITVTNKGTSPGNVTPDMLIPSTGDFIITNQLPIKFGKLLPDSSFTYELCFRPTRLRNHSWKGTTILNPCYTASQQTMQGTGYDSIIVRMNTDVMVKPGDYIPIPIQLLNSVPAEYRVDSLMFTVAYNSTLLDTASVPVSSNNTSSAPLSSIRLYSTRFAGDTMFVDYTLKGQSLNQPTPDSTLLNLQFKMLNPSVMQSNVTLTSLRFADGNPKVGIIQPAVVRVDPTCFQAKRLFNTSGLRFVQQTSYLVQSSNPTITLTSIAKQNTQTSITMFSILGEAVYQRIEIIPEGTHETTITLPSVAIGTYYLVVQQSGEFISIPVTVY